MKVVVLVCPAHGAHRLIVDDETITPTPDIIASLDASGAEFVKVTVLCENCREER